MQKVEIVNDNLGHLAEESLNLSVKGAACFHRAVYRKMWEGRDKLREDLPSKKWKGPDGLENWQSIQIAKDTTKKKLTVRNTSSGDKHSVTVQLFASASEGSKDQKTLWKGDNSSHDTIDFWKRLRMCEVSNFNKFRRRKCKKINIIVSITVKWVKPTVKIFTKQNWGSIQDQDLSLFLSCPGFGTLVLFLCS